MCCSASGISSVCVCVWSSLAAPSSLAAGPPPLPVAAAATPAPTDPGPPSPEARAPPVATVREVDTPTAS
eukprot:484106-Prymnesium_polylepis.1